MNKSTTYVGQHVLSQILSLCPKNEIAHLFAKAKSDYKVKRLKSWEHFVTMMFSVLSASTSLRETCMGLEAYEGKLKPAARCPMPTSGGRLPFSRQFSTTSTTNTKGLSRTAPCQKKCFLSCFWWTQRCFPCSRQYLKQQAGILTTEGKRGA